MSVPVAHGLIIGKFYPPHAGHHAIIRLAAAECSQVTVVVMASFAETIALADRVAWLAAEHASEQAVSVVGIRCDAPLDLADDTVWAAQIASMRAAIAQVTSEPVTAVYSAEDYGDTMAERLGATHRRVARVDDGLSATAVRADLASLWSTLAPPTRAGLATRVVVVGAESTGTTTVAQALAREYRRRGGAWADTACVAEFGREYTEIKWAADVDAARASGRTPPELDQIVWTADDFDLVAAEQTRRENLAAADGSPLLVCDTDAFATSVWERRYLAADARGRQPWAAAHLLPRHDLYLVTDHVGVPWLDDGLREGDLAIRAAMTQWFLDELTAAGHSWVLLTGDLDQRTSLALRTVDALVEHRLRFARALTGPGFG